MAAALGYAAALPARAAIQEATADVPVAGAPLAIAGFHELPSSGEERFKYELARALAIRLLNEAKGLQAPLAELANTTAGELARARLFVASDAEADRQCAAITASLFVRQDLPGNIYICADTRWHVLHEPDSVTNIMAQILIHEGAHLTGNTDECEATTLELVVAGNSVGITNYANFHKYARECQGTLDLRALRRQGLRM